MEQLSCFNVNRDPFMASMHHRGRVFVDGHVYIYMNIRIKGIGSLNVRARIFAQTNGSICLETKSKKVVERIANVCMCMCMDGILD